MQKYQAYSFPLKLKMLRLEAGKSQEDLAGELGISRSCLANYETGKRQPDAEMLSKIAQVCHVMTDFFIEQPLYREVPLQEGETDKTKKLKALIQNHGNSLDISHLPTAHRLCMIEFYDYILNTQQQNRQSRHVYRIHQ